MPGGKRRRLRSIGCCRSWHVNDNSRPFRHEGVTARQDTFPRYESKPFEIELWIFTTGLSKESLEIGHRDVPDVS